MMMSKWDRVKREMKERVSVFVCVKRERERERSELSR